MRVCLRATPQRVCRQCQWRLTGASAARSFATKTAAAANTEANAESNTKSKAAETSKDIPEEPELGPLARKLQEATEEALFTGGRAGRQAIESAGFSDELKDRLLDKIANTEFKDQHADAFSQAGLNDTQPGTPIAGYGDAAAWTGEEATPDAVRRMLEDAHKPLKPELRGKRQLGPIDTRMKRAPVLSPSQKISSARQRASEYTGLSEKEKEEMKKQLQERFEPEGRMASTISGMTSLANERIANAIARGQFKDIKRGPGVKRDDMVDNAFVDTTEYLMNRIIKRQDIVPPWIEKQQELAKEANVFRTRMRSDWKRHAARMIASKGGPLQEQMQRAELYAAAERAHNPIGGSDEGGGGADGISTVSRPFRDPDWERTEAKYMRLAVERLNGIARSYNLMAPDLAKKPYYSVERELARCFADVAPLLAGEIKERARIPAKTSLGLPQASRSGNTVTGHVPGNEDAKVHPEGDEKAYGMKEFWRDIWKK